MILGKKGDISEPIIPSCLKPHSLYTPYGQESKLLTVPIDPVISSREIFFQPDMEADELIAVAHFLDLELCLTGAAVAPGNRDNGEGKSLGDGFEKKLDCDVEVRRQNRAYAIDHSFAVGLEGIRRIVEGVVEENPHKRICKAIYK